MKDKYQGEKVKIVNYNDETISSKLIDTQPTEHSKGEKQQNSYRDPFFGVFFYIHLIAIVLLVIKYGTPLVTNSHGKNNSGSGNFIGIMFAALATAVLSCLLSIGMLVVMMKHATYILEVSLISSAVLCLAWTVTNGVYGLYWAMLISLFLFFANVWYARVVWSRIPFAAANLNTGFTAVRANFGVVFIAFLLAFFTIIYTILWSIPVTGIYHQSSYCDYEGTTCQKKANMGDEFILLVALFWTHQVTKNVIHVTVAGTVGTWWFVPEEASSFFSQGVRQSFLRATTYSFGSICFGSLIVAVVRALRYIKDYAQQDENGGILTCLVECILGYIEAIIEYVNKWAFIYVGLYGYSYMEGGKNVMTLFAERGFTTIITDDLVSNALSLLCIVFGGLFGCVGLILALTLRLFTGHDFHMTLLSAYLISFIVGLMISSITLSVVESAVDTVIVCFAEAPADFQRNHPYLSQKMRDAWRDAYPEVST